MTRLIKKLFKIKKGQFLINDPLESLIDRLLDPTDPLYDEKFATGRMLDENTEPR